MKKIKLLVLSMFAVILLSTGCGAEKVESKEEKVNFINNNASYFVIIDGKKFIAGDKISSLSKVGYNLKTSEAALSLSANKYMIGAGNMVNSASKNIFDVTPFNTKSSSIKVADAVIGGIDIDYYYAKNDKKAANFEVYGGIKLGSTKEAVKKAFGEPSSEIGTNVYKYESDETYRSYKFTFDDEEKVSEIVWQNLVFNKTK